LNSKWRELVNSYTHYESGNYTHVYTSTYISSKLYLTGFNHISPGLTIIPLA